MIARNPQDSENSALLVAPGYEGVTEAWFQPEFWDNRAKPVTTGGRGGAWFIDATPRKLVLRHYRRGGFVARLVEKSYWFSGYESARSLAEFRLLTELKSRGLPVPEPVAALAWKYRLFWYHAAILVERIPGAVTLPDSSDLSEKSLWIQLGGMIRRFHDHGLNHVDLNCDNILVSGDEMYLIDFDRCELLPERDNRPNSAWKQRNIERLHRSVKKRCQKLSPDLQECLWQHMLQAYAHKSDSTEC
ncbi:MAG: 3-deoxy-D-manno-octulosonic acid kinase [Marinobacter sp.]|uniref:3-deoxy-D-manno-octulosonic acid kinase n=1 Tax=Marinobacter sp. TaxID=50741 RepID=UPI003C4E9B06